MLSKAESQWPVGQIQLDDIFSLAHTVFWRKKKYRKEKERKKIKQLQ